MKTILDLIVEELKPAFTGCGYDEKYIRVTVSNLSLIHISEPTRP